MTAIGQDLRYALRMLARSPGFAAVAVATLALGIGANTAIFSVVNAVLLKPLPFSRPEELVRVTGDLKGQGLSDAGMSPPELFDYRDRSGAFSAMSGLFPINANITGLDHPERAEVLLVDVNYFDLLGVKPQVGRSRMAALGYGVGPRDPITFLLVTGILSAVALAATDLPARRASRVDPMRALRGD